MSIDIQDLVVTRGSKTIVDGLNLQVKAGEIYALLGGNGVGKSTTLLALLGLLKARSGRLTVNQVNVSTNPDAARAIIAYLPESVALYDHLTALENVHYFLDLAGLKPDRGEIEAAFDAVKLPASAWAARFGTFSKGMRQKTAIALALLRNTPVLLLDEPTSGLDPSATRELATILQGLRGKGVSILMVTHDLLNAADVADRIGLLSDGKIAQEWTAQDSVDRFDVRALHHALNGSPLP